MKFKKIGVKQSGGNIDDYSTKNFMNNPNYKLSIFWSGEVQKGDDINEADPLDFVVNCEYRIKECSVINYSFYCKLYSICTG